MAFNIGLGIVTADRHELHKAIQQLGIYSGSLKDESSVINPSILMQVPEGTAQQANYLNFTVGSRNWYYWIKDCVFKRTGVVEFICEVDPLMTYENEIRNLNCTIDRNENEADSYLYDENYKIDAYSNIVTIDFPQGFGDEQLILLTVG